MFPSEINIPLSISRKSFTYQTVVLSQPRKHLYVFLYIIQSNFLYYFNWKIKICLNHDNIHGYTRRFISRMDVEPACWLPTFFMIYVNHFFVINVVDLTLTNSKAHQYYILCEIITYVTMFVLWAITGYLCYKFEFLDYLIMLTFLYLTEYESSSVEYSSVDESLSVDG